MAQIADYRHFQTLQQDVLLTAVADLDLDPALRVRLAEFLLSLDELEVCAEKLRDDQLESLVSDAMVACGLADVKKAHEALQWLFAPPDIVGQSFN